MRLSIYQRAIFPIVPPRSSVAVVTPRAWKTRLMVGILMLLLTHRRVRKRQRSFQTRHDGECQLCRNAYQALLLNCTILIFRPVPYLLFFSVKIFLSNSLCFNNLFLGCFLSLLDYSMCGNNQCIGLCVPECKQVLSSFSIFCVIVLYNRMVY